MRSADSRRSAARRGAPSARSAAMLLRAAALLATLLFCGCSTPGKEPAGAGGARPGGASGAAALPAATASPEIAITRDGVAHVRGATLESAYFGLGWVTARDRAGQIELLRRTAEGRAGEMVGNRALQGDGFVRALDLMGRARAIAADLRRAPFARRAFAAYAAGVNARFDSLRAGLVPPPRDLVAAGVRPGRWTPEHSIAVALLQGLRLDGDFPQLDHAELAEKRGEATARASWAHEPLVEYWSVEDSLVRAPGAPPGALGEVAALPAALPAAAATGEDRGDRSLSADARAYLAAALPAGGPGASNAWAVGGGRTRRGAALLANDTHLGLATPSTWYAAHVTVPDSLDAIGLLVPGLPLISAGRNRDLAWGVTALGGMAFEVYRESLDASGKRALFRGRWEPIRSRGLGLRYRLGPLELPLFWVRSRHTRHGVVVTLDRKRRQAYALRWAAMEPWPAGAEDFGWERATTLEAFRAHLAGVFAPTLNWVVAERSGHVLYQAAGWVPRRDAGLPDLAPTPGFDGRHEWSGPVPFDSMPHAIRDADGVVVNSNNHPSGPESFAPVGVFTAAEWRARRVRELLGRRRDLTAGDMQAIQGDARSPQWPVFGPLMLARAHAVADTSARRRKILRALAGWNGDALPGGFAPAAFRAWWNELSASLVTPGREGLLLAVLRGEEPATWLLPRPAAGRGRSPSKAEPLPSGASAAVDSAVARALTRALDGLAARLGPDSRAWDWARAHRARFRHALERQDRTLTPRSVAVRGDRGTVCVGSSSLPRDTLVTHGPVMRLVFDLADSSGWYILPPGNSGDPNSPHYDDQLEAWSELRYRKLDLAWPSPAEVERSGRVRLPFRPAP